MTVAAASTALAALQAPLLGLGEAAATFHLADPQFEYLGRRVFVDNVVLDRVIPSSSRNVASMVTGPLYVDTLLSLARRGQPGPNVGLQILGDLADTPCRSEMADFEAVLAMHPLPVEGYDRGNHSSSNAFGSVNLLARSFRWLKKWIDRIFGKTPNLDQALCTACGGQQNVLTPQETTRGMHRMLHRHREGSRPIEDLDVKVAAAGDKGYRLRGASQPVPFDPAHLDQNFTTFWRPAAGERYWDAVVNFDLADRPYAERKTRVNSIYLQASLQARFQAADGGEVPVYTISLDTQDTRNLISVFPGVSEFQVRLIETFIDQKLKENPRARFKLSGHFPTTQLLNLTTPCGARKALKRLLAREEVVLVTSAHTHRRMVEDLTQRLGLKRETPLTEVTVPSLVDYSPAHNRSSKEYQDARAMAIETICAAEEAGGQTCLKIAMEFKGIDGPDLYAQGLTQEVRQALDAYKREHGYMRARETMRELRTDYLKGFLVRQVRRVGEFFTVGLNPWHAKTFREYWREQSLLRNILNNLTTVSIVQMFNEAEHLMPMLESILHFMVADRSEPGDFAVEGQIRGVLTALQTEYPVRKEAFDAAFASGAYASELTQFNDLYVRTGVDRLPRMLLGLKEGGRARAFAVMAGVEASQEEYRFHRRRPTKIPNKPPTITVPV